MRYGYKLFKAWKSNGIDADEAKDLIEELFTIIIFILEEFEMELEEDVPEEPEDDAEEISEEEEWARLEDEHEAVVEASGLPKKKRIFKKSKGKK
jgi:hypothetical protein